MFGEKVHGGGRPFQILNGRPPLVSGALLGLDVVLNVNEQVDLPAALSGLSGWPGASGDARDNCFFRIIGAQSFEPGEPLLIRRPGGDILSPLDFISFPLQPDNQIFQAGGYGDQPVNGGFQLCLVADAVLCGLMLNVALTLIPAGDNPGEMEDIWNFSLLLSRLCRLSLLRWALAWACGALSICWRATVPTTRAPMLMYGKEASNRKQ